jgi:hypothetical protein
MAVGILIIGCDDQSENIPTSPENISTFMAQGWASYAAEDFEAARLSFIEANQRNAFYLPAYDGLGWCAVRMTDFAEAAIQFSFITTLADPAEEAALLADAYAGLCLSATIERSVLEISGEATAEELDDLAQESIDMAQLVFDLFPGDDYSPEDHDPGFGSLTLHLFNAQNYFYLQEFGNSEMELTVVDTGFVAAQLLDFGTEVTGELILLAMEVQELDTLWMLDPVNMGIHSIVGEVTPPDTTLNLDYQVLYADNRVQVVPVSPTVIDDLSVGLEFTMDYVYIDDFAAYLSSLISQIESLIEF